MKQTLAECQLIEFKEPSEAVKRLQPLLRGKPVAFRVNDAKMFKKRRVSQPILTITPSTVYGMEGGVLIFAVTGHGCEAVPVTQLKPMALYRTGLSMRVAKFLVRELKELFNQ